MNRILSMLEELDESPEDWELRIQVCELLFAEGHLDESMSILNDYPVSTLPRDLLQKVRDLLEKIELAAEGAEMEEEQAAMEADVAEAQRRAEAEGFEPGPGGIDPDDARWKGRRMPSLGGSTRRSRLPKPPGGSSGRKKKVAGATGRVQRAPVAKSTAPSRASSKVSRRGRQNKLTGRVPIRPSSGDTRPQKGTQSWAQSGPQVKPLPRPDTSPYRQKDPNDPESESYSPPTAAEASTPIVPVTPRALTPPVREGSAAIASASSEPWAREVPVDEAPVERVSLPEQGPKLILPARDSDGFDDDNDAAGDAAFLAFDDDAARVYASEAPNRSGDRLSALTVAVLVHAAIVILLGLIVIAVPRQGPPQIVANAYRAEVPENIRKVKIQRHTPTASAGEGHMPTMAIAASAVSPIAIPQIEVEEFVEDLTLGAGFSMPVEGAGKATTPTDPNVTEVAEPSKVSFYGIRAQGDRMVFLIEASKRMLTDPKGGIPAYDKVKQDLGRLLTGMNDSTRFNVILFEGQRIAPFQEELVEATEDNVAALMEWFEPINRVYENVGLPGDYRADTGLNHEGDPIPIANLSHYTKALQMALEMEASNVFAMTSGWAAMQRPYDPDADRRRDRGNGRGWDEREQREWEDAMALARAWLERENAARRERGIPQKVILNWDEILREVAPGVTRPRGGGGGGGGGVGFTGHFSMEEVEEHVGNLVDDLYRDRRKARPEINLIWFIGEDEQTDTAVEIHFDRLAKRNRGRMRILEGLEGLNNVTSFRGDLTEN